MFLGVVVPAPAGQTDWLYLEGRNHLVRRVALGSAPIVYGDEVRNQQRRSKPVLSEGTEVRVKAEQDGEGEWRAVRIEIIRPAPPRVEAGRNKT